MIKIKIKHKKEKALAYPKLMENYGGVMLCLNDREALALSGDSIYKTTYAEMSFENFKGRVVFKSDGTDSPSLVQLQSNEDIILFMEFDGSKGRCLGYVLRPGISSTSKVGEEISFSSDSFKPYLHKVVLSNKKLHL